MAIAFIHQKTLRERLLFLYLQEFQRAIVLYVGEVMIEIIQTRWNVVLKISRIDEILE